MRKQIVLSVKEEDIKAKRTYKLYTNPIALAAMRQFRKRVDLYGDCMYVGAKRFMMTERTKEIFLKSQTKPSSLKPCRLGFTRAT